MQNASYNEKNYAKEVSITNMGRPKAVSEVVSNMDKQLREILKSPKMLWENTYVKHQQDNYCNHKF